MTEVGGGGTHENAVRKAKKTGAEKASRAKSGARTTYTVNQT